MFATWWGLVGAGVQGKRAHDARLVAFMRVNGIDAVLTVNTPDFESFAEIRVHAPSTL